jgi:benzoate transport
MDLKIQDVINVRPMTRFQAMAVFICVLLNMLDGFDVLVVAFTAAEISRVWALSGTQMGMLLSAGLVGMSVGSIFVAPLADRWGRRAIVLVCLLLITVGMLLSALARGPYDLAALRVLTGVGIGGMLASLTVITAEYSSARRRNLCLSLYSTGYPIGAVLGGSLSAFLIAHYGFRAVFAVGGLLSLAMIPAVLARMPESLDFLLEKRPPRALERVNALLAKLAHPTVPALPERSHGQSAQASLARLFKAPLGLQTALIWTAFLTHMLCFYFVVSWTPKLLTSAGLSPTQGISGGVVLSLGGILGGVGLGLVSSRFRLGAVTATFMLLAGILMLLFGLFAGSLVSALPIAFAVGFFIYGAMMGLYALTPQLHPPLLRATGMGFAIGMGRAGGILSPILAGFLLDAGWRPEHVFFAFAAPMLIALVAVFSLRTSAPGAGDQQEQAVRDASSATSRARAEPRVSA